jgi:abequosyltransferase
MSDPILSICIPTYNRSKYLFRLLESLVHEIADNSLPVNIKITNNASTDDTKSVCDDFSKKYDFISVVHQLENYGADFNISTAFSLSNGKYTWIIGDDDYASEGAITLLLNLIENLGSPDLISLGADFSGNTVSNPLSDQLSFSVHSSAISFVRVTGVMLTFISGMVIKRPADFCLRDCLDQFNNSCLIQLSWVLRPLVEDGIFVKVDDCFVIAEPDNTGGYRLFDVFSVKLKFICDSVLGVNSNITPIILRSSSRFLISLTHKSVKSNFVRDLDFSTLDKVFGHIFAYKYCYRFLYKYPFLWRLARVVKKIIRM